MRIGIVAPKELQTFWEHQLRGFQSVREVVMVNQLEALSEVDACIYGAASADPNEELLKLLKQAIHVFWILPLPHSVKTANTFIRTAEESRTTVQFICWPIHSPALQKMMQIIPHPDRIVIDRKISHEDFIKSALTEEQLYRDEIAYCSYWINHSIHDLSVSQLPENGKHAAFTLLDLHFADSTHCTIRVETIAKQYEHQRSASDQKRMLKHDVTEDSLTKIETNKDGNLHIAPENIPDNVPAQLALSSFFRSISQPTYRIFDPYELKRYCTVMEALERKRTR